jgi:two-component system, NtrC family, sensor histidine kinase HupT/HoxJ
MTSPTPTQSTSLIAKAGVKNELDLSPDTENAWLEVIYKMDAVYADLVQYQIDLEDKNSALEDAQRFISSVMSSMTDVLIVCDVQGNIQRTNKALEELTGKSESQLLGTALQSIFASDSLGAVESFLETINTDRIMDLEVNLTDWSGELAPLAMNCSLRFDYKGRLVGMVLIGRPVGELRRAYAELNAAHKQLTQTQEQLVHAEKMASLGRLVAGVAHELNNPISFVFGNMHALKRYGSNISEYLNAVDTQTHSQALLEKRKDLKIEKILGDIESLIEGTLEGAERVSDIVTDLRRYSGGQKEQVDEFDLSRVTRTAAEWVLKACSVKPTVNYEIPDVLMITGHKGHIHQIIGNLVQNAVDVIEGSRQCEINISIHEKNDRVYLTVLDSGPGIPQSDISSIFDPFFTTKPVGKGTGLGLYISYGLARNLGGDLRVSNHHEGGALFTLELLREGLSA